MEADLAIFIHNKRNNLKWLNTAIPILSIHVLETAIKPEANMEHQGPYLRHHHLQIRNFAPYSFLNSWDEPSGCHSCGRYVCCQNSVLIRGSISNCLFKIVIQLRSIFEDVSSSFAVFCSTKSRTSCICEHPEFIHGRLSYVVSTRWVFRSVRLFPVSGRRRWLDGHRVEVVSVIWAMHMSTNPNIASTVLLPMRLRCFWCAEL